MALTITYEIINGEFPITVTLNSTSDPDRIPPIATNVHTAIDGYGQYTFDSVPEDDYILTFTDALGCTFPLTVCDLSAEITDIVYPCEFDFTINWVETMPSPSRTPTPSPTQPPTPTPTPTITITPTVSCARPGGLTLYSWWYISGSTGYIFYTGLTAACEVLSQWSIYSHYQGTGGFIASTAIGEPIYPGSGTSCVLLPDGFWIRTSGFTSPTIVQVVNGHIYAYPPCPSPTLTPTPTITPTKTPTPTITLSKTPSRTPTATRMASRTPTPTPTITPSTSPSAPNFKITGVIDSACTPLLGLYFIQIIVTGGTAPYQYSIDNGVTYTAPTNATSYIFPLSAPFGTEVYDITVLDSSGINYRWPRISCGSLSVQIWPIYLTATASGTYRYFYDGPSQPTHFWDLNLSIQASEPYGTVVEAVGNPDVGTTFLGWSYELADRFTINNIVWITEDETLIYTFNADGVKIYGYFIDDGQNGPISIDFCYNTGTGRDPSDADKLYLCTTCADLGGTTETIYFNITEYTTLGIEGATWYKDSALTQTADNGFYIDSSQTYSTIYGVANGIPINYGTCGGGTILTC